KFLDNFLFPPEKQYTFIEKLSGGEKKRLQLLKLLITSPNFLVLDEPTNDFDIDTLNVLEDFLEKFSGCLLLVSHDRYFMDHLVDQLFIFEGDGKIKMFNGNYTYYRDTLKGEHPEEDEQEVVVPELVQKSKKKVSLKDKLEYENLEQSISKLEAEKLLLTEKLNSGVTSHQQLLEWSQQIEKLTKQIDNNTARWLELGEMISA